MISREPQPLALCFARARGRLWHRTFHRSGFVSDSPVARTSLERALHPAGSHPFSSPRKNRLPDDSRFFVVDDQGFEVAYMSLKPSKERRLSDIIFVQYSKNTQKYSFLALAGELRKVPFHIQIAREALTTLWMIR